MSALLDRAVDASTQYWPNTNHGNAAAFSQPVDGNSEVVRSAWQTVIDELREFRSLTDDWDGDGAIAPGVAVVDTALSKAIRLRHDYHSPPDRVIAGVNGTVIFEWFLINRLEQIEVFAPDEVEVRIGGIVLQNATEMRPIH